MKTMKSFQHCILVWVKKGEDFPGCQNIPGKQGYYLLWTGGSLSDFKRCEYLGVSAPDEKWLDSYLAG